MTRIETRAVVRDDHTVTVQLPNNIEPGEHPIVVLVDSSPRRAPDDDSPSNASKYFRQEGNLRVFTGKLLDDPINLVKRIYAEREHRFIYGPWE